MASAGRPRAFGSDPLTGSGRARRSLHSQPSTSAQVMTFMKWVSLGRNVATLHFSYLYNVVTLSVDVATLL